METDLIPACKFMSASEYSVIKSDVILRFDCIHLLSSTRKSVC